MLAQGLKVMVMAMAMAMAAIIMMVVMTAATFMGMTGTSLPAIQ
jgi:hypothetical protein